jgi:hypothetical protein
MISRDFKSDLAVCAVKIIVNGVAKILTDNNFALKPADDTCNTALHKLIMLFIFNKGWGPKSIRNKWHI